MSLGFDPLDQDMRTIRGCIETMQVIKGDMFGTSESNVRVTTESIWVGVAMRKRKNGEYIRRRKKNHKFELNEAVNNFKTIQQMKYKVF